LRPEKKEKYIHYTPHSKIGDWRAEWFYVENHAPSLLERVPGPPQMCNKWFVKGANAEQEEELLTRIENLKNKGVTSISVVFSWTVRRIQPLQKRCNQGFEYIGVTDPSHFSSERIHELEAIKRVHKVLDGVSTKPV
jgi:hypothetical protein